MAKAKRSGKAYSSGYASYKSEGREVKNRLKKLTRLLKEQPNNLQIQAAIKDIHHRRHIPKEPYWSHQKIADAKIFKYFTGKFDKGIYQTDPKLQHAALVARNPNKFKNFVQTKSSQFEMFSLKERAHDGIGNLVWKQ